MEIERLDDGTFIHIQSGFILLPCTRTGRYRVIGKMEDGEFRDIEENDMEEASQLGFITDTETHPTESIRVSIRGVYQRK